jgi:hypothetical protein
MKCPDDKTNPCAFARACPYHGNRKVCAEAVRLGIWGKPESKKLLKRSPYAEENINERI